jgi:hypothetical protein
MKNKAENRVARLGEILQFWLLFKGEIRFVVCILSVQKDLVEDVLDLKIKV